MRAVYAEVGSSSLAMLTALGATHLCVLTLCRELAQRLLDAGAPTVNKKFGTKVAVLVGDFLFAQSSWFLAQLDNLEVRLHRMPLSWLHNMLLVWAKVWVPLSCLHTLFVLPTKPGCYAAVDLANIGSVLRAYLQFTSLRVQVIKLISQVIAVFANGEISQQQKVFDSSITLDEYMDKNFYKTASLIAASCKSAAVFSECSQDIKDSMFEYGRHLGLAFQIIDDILDFTQTAEQLGKPQVSALQITHTPPPRLCGDMILCHHCLRQQLFYFSECCASILIVVS